MVRKKKISQKKIGGNPIHIMLNVDEAFEGERDVLNSEVSALKISQSIENYKNLRIEELTKKQLVLKRFSEIKRNLTKLQGLLPTLKIPKILEHESPVSIEETPEEKAAPVQIDLEKPSPSSIDIQLREIQDKLERLSQR